MRSWFNKTKAPDVWDDAIAFPLGDIEAAQKVRAICRAAAGCAAAVATPNARPQVKQQAERERYERAAKVAMEVAMKMSDPLMRDAAVREIITLCMTAKNIKTARALYRAIHAGSIKAEVLKQHPELERGAG